MAWLFGHAVSTLKDKPYGRTPIRLDTERIVDLVDLALSSRLSAAGLASATPRRRTREHAAELDCRRA